MRKREGAGGVVGRLPPYAFSDNLPTKDSDMAIKLSSIKADLKREHEGDWVEIPDLPGVRLKVRGFSYGPYQIAKNLVEQKWIRKYGKDPVAPDVQDRDNGKLYVDHILLDWEGFDEPYTKERAMEILTDPAFRELAGHVRYAGMRVAARDIEFTEEAAKNSGAPSGGTSHGAARKVG